MTRLGAGIAMNRVARILGMLSLGLTLSSVGPAQTSVSPHAETAPHAKVSQGDPVKRSMASLVGRSIYSCLLYPYSSPMARANPVYFDATDAQGKAIPNASVHRYFNAGDKLVIRGAETDMLPVVGRMSPTVRISLNVENQTNNVSAGVEVEVYSSEVTPSKILGGLVNGVWYSLRPVTDAYYPEIGASRNDVICRLGSPDHTNSDAVGGDQMVYFGGKLYVYISPRTERVTNVQSSF